MGSSDSDCDTITAITEEVIAGAAVKILTLSP